MGPSEKKYFLLIFQCLLHLLLRPCHGWNRREAREPWSPVDTVSRGHRSEQKPTGEVEGDLKWRRSIALAVGLGAPQRRLSVALKRLEQAGSMIIRALRSPMNWVAAV